MRSRTGVVIVLLHLSVSTGRADRAPGPVDFNGQVRPILSDKCFFCHGPDKNQRKAGLRLDLAESALADREGGRAIVPGSVKDSELVRRITSRDAAVIMPPATSHKVLRADDVAILIRWIEEGAEYKGPWIYEQPVRHEPPAVASAMVNNAIDRFVQAELVARHRKPAPEADRVALLRRLSFDLTGLPPTRAEVGAFVSADAPDAYERVVDRLLASPAYGERMATKWLDLVRYADTVGYHGDQNLSQSPYRDYVILSFNENLPYDQFTREQLAGDLLADPTLRQRVASGYNRLNMTTEEGGAQPKEYLAKYAGDRVRNTSAVWMGATLGCAECHDHKYDPYTMRDFYSFAAFFADLQEVGKYDAVKRPPEIPVPSLLEEPERLRIEQDIAALKLALGTPVSSGRAEALARLQQQEEALEQMTASAPTMPVSVAADPRVTRVLARGDWMDESGEIVEPAIPAFLGTLATDGRRATRLDLANWLVSGKNPMTARVFVNHLWHMFFGAGLSNVLGDLGNQGEPPSHPRLLDWLAVELVECGWDVKHMVKLIVQSHTYRQAARPAADAAQRDPYNRLLAGQSRRRLTAEMIRDNALRVSGLLVDRVGGPSVFPYQPAGHYAQLNFPQRTYQQSTDENQWRRALYTHWQRTFLHPALQAFDAPSREACTAQRPLSNTPLQALVLMNDPSFVEAARFLAARAMDEGGAATDERIMWMVTEVLSRVPRAGEAQVLGDVYRKHLETYRADPAGAKALIGVGLRKVKTNPEPVEWAAWTSVARVLLNLHETLTRN